MFLECFLYAGTLCIRINPQHIYYFLGLNDCFSNTIPLTKKMQCLS